MRTCIHTLHSSVVTSTCLHFSVLFTYRSTLTFIDSCVSESQIPVFPRVSGEGQLGDPTPPGWPLWRTTLLWSMLSNWLWISRCGDYWQQAELRTDGACRIMMMMMMCFYRLLLCCCDKMLTYLLFTLQEIDCRVFLMKQYFLTDIICQ